METKETKIFLDTIYHVMVKYCKWNNIELNSIFLERKLVEEIGELTQSLLIKDGMSRSGKTISDRDIEDEMADVFGILICLSKLRKCDIIEGVKRKWFKWLNN